MAEPESEEPLTPLVEAATQYHVVYESMLAGGFTPDAAQSIIAKMMLTGQGPQDT